MDYFDIGYLRPDRVSDAQALAILSEFLGTEDLRCESIGDMEVRVYRNERESGYFTIDVRHESGCGLALVSEETGEMKRMSSPTFFHNDYFDDVLILLSELNQAHAVDALNTCFEFDFEQIANAEARLKIAR